MLQAHVGVFSFYRQQPNAPECDFFHGSESRQPGDEHVLLRRAFQTLTHELGHTLGLKHCIYFSCLMQGANSLEEAERRIPDLCPVCLRKLVWCLGAESSAGVRGRYERLLQFYEAASQQGFERHLAWVRGRLGLPMQQEPPPPAEAVETQSSRRLLPAEQQQQAAASATAGGAAAEQLLGIRPLGRSEDGLCEVCEE